MRTLLIVMPALLITTGCLGPDLADYCGEPDETAADWADGYENSAQDTHDGLLGLWEGEADIDGDVEPMRLVINEATSDPVLRTYPDAGEGYDNVQVSDGCLDSYRITMPVQIILDDSGIDIDFDMELSESGFSGGWHTTAEIEIPDCSEEPCALVLSFDRYNVDSNEIVGKLRWEDTTEDDSGAATIYDANVTLTRITE